MRKALQNENRRRAFVPGYLNVLGSHGSWHVVSSRDAIKPSSKAPNVNREIAVILKVDGYAGSDGRSR